jgi:hypothetical protein
MNSIDRKLRKLEMAKASREQDVCRGLAAVMHGVPRERLQTLGPGERVVIDWYRDGGGMVWGRERITNDPTDKDRKCITGGYLLDVLKEIHQGCSHRLQSGSCLICKGTPVAEKRLLCAEEEFPIEPASVRW